MARVIVTLKVMPTSPEVDMTQLQSDAEAKIKAKGADNNIKAEVIPIAFGLKAIHFTFSIDETKGSPDPIAEAIEELDNCQSAEVIMVSRALG